MRIIKRSNVSLLKFPSSDDIRATATFARISRYNANQGKEYSELEDRKLIQNLYNWKHYTPLRYLQIMFQIETPLFIAEQLKRHTIGIIPNQMSYRYNSKPLGFYIPYDEDTDEYKTMFSSYMKSYLTYKQLLDKKVKPEIARSVLPTALLTSLGIVFNIQSFEHVLKTRTDNHAQEEIRYLMTEMYNKSRYFPFNLIKLKGSE